MRYQGRQGRWGNPHSDTSMSCFHPASNHDDMSMGLTMLGPRGSISIVLIGSHTIYRSLSVDNRHFITTDSKHYRAMIIITSV